MLSFSSEKVLDWHTYFVVRGMSTLINLSIDWEFSCFCPHKMILFSTVKALKPLVNLASRVRYS